MSSIPITTYCTCKLKSGYIDGDRDQIICNVCDGVIKGSESFTMAEVAEYNERYQRYLETGRQLDEIEQIVNGGYQASDKEINERHEKHRDRIIDNIY